MAVAMRSVARHLLFSFLKSELFYNERMTFQNKVAASWQHFVKTTFIFKKRGEWRDEEVQTSTSNYRRCLRF